MYPCRGLSIYTRSPWISSSKSWPDPTHPPSRVAAPHASSSGAPSPTRPSFAASTSHFLLALLYHRRFPFPYTETLRRPPLFATATPPVSVVANVTAELDGPYDPVASRGGLIVLRREEYASRLCVCDPVVGRRYVLTPDGITDILHVIMPKDGDDGNDLAIKLLVADNGLRTQTYSSKVGAWGEITRTPACIPASYQQVRPYQVLLDGVAHWLYRERTTPTYTVLALDVGTGQAAWIVVPQECHRRRITSTADKPGELLLVSTSDGKLGLLVWERPIAVTMWAAAADTGSEPGRSWTRRVVIQWATILRSVKPLSRDPLACQHISFEWFAEGSGTVVFQMSEVGIVLLNLRTLEVRHLKRSPLELPGSSPFCVYELHTAKLLLAR